MGDSIQIYLQNLRRIPLLTKDAEKELFLNLAKNNENAKKAIWQSNLRLVVSIARKYLHRGIALDDLISIGNEALSKAIDNFDVERNFKFSTYATPCIKWAITEAIKKLSGFKLTNDERDNLSKFCAIKEKLSKKNPRVKPSLVKIAKAMKISRAEALKIQELENYSKSLPLNAPNEAGDFREIEDPNGQADTEDLTEIFSKSRARAEKFLDVLTGQERKVAELRFGLLNGKCHSLQEIAQVLGVSKKRIFTVEKKAVKKIRNAITNQ